MRRLLGFSGARALIAVSLSVSLVAFAAGCGDENSPESDATQDVPGQDITVTPDQGNDSSVDTRVDTSDTAATDAGHDDTATEEVAQELPPDLEPPFVVATYPADEETGVPLDFVVRITFNEPMREVMLTGKFIKVYDINDQELAGALSYDPVSYTVSFTPDAALEIYQLAPYRIWLDGDLQDLAANELGSDKTFRFSTEGPQDMDGYRAIAAKYSPKLYQSTDSSQPRWDYPTIINFDGDWISENNNAAMAAATSVPVWVYYDVIETYTHYFIRYHYFYVKHQDTSNTFGNEVAGSMVVVQKNPEMPIAVETYFGNGSFEDIRSFVTTESGLVVDGGNGDYNDNDRKSYNVNWVFPQDQLFPGGHFQNYISKQSHESCAWIQTTQESGMDFHCVLSVASKSTLNIMHFSYTDGTAGTMTAPFAYSNAEGNDVGYGLRLAVEDWWARRDRTAVGDLFSSTFKFDAPTGLVGKNMILPTAFRSSPDGTQPGGKSPWRWKWNPAVVNAYTYFQEFPEGTFYVHPAYYFAQRHRMTLTTDNSGFSGTYCYNPYLLIDKRGLTADCSTIN